MPGWLRPEETARQLRVRQDGPETTPAAGAARSAGLLLSRASRRRSSCARRGGSGGVRRDRQRSCPYSHWITFRPLGSFGPPPRWFLTREARPPPPRHPGAAACLEKGRSGRSISASPQTNPTFLHLSSRCLPEMLLRASFAAAPIIWCFRRYTPAILCPVAVATPPAIRPSPMAILPAAKAFLLISSLAATPFKC